MKLALCLQYPIGLRGGVSVLVEVLATEFARRGHQIVLVSQDPPESLRGLALGKIIHRHISWNPPRESAAEARRLAGLLAAENVDLVHFHAGGHFGWGNRYPGQCPVLYLDRMGIPCIFTSHLVVGLFEGYCSPRKPFWFKAAILPLAWCGKMSQLRHVRREIAVSQHDFKKLRRWYGPLRNRIGQIYHSRLPDAGSDNTGTRQPIILNVGHIAWRKGQLVLAQAFAAIAARHPEWTLQLAGHDGGDGIVEKIRELDKTHGLGGRIQLLGERNDTMDLMRQASIYVQPSYWEALGLALQEAMYCGCPAVGSRAGGIPELIQEGQTGLLVEPGNVAQLGAALEKLIQDRTYRENLGRNGAASIPQRGMTIESMVARHLEEYQAALGS